MRILHLSDLHFGTETDILRNDLTAHIKSVPADLLVVSGDFTQTASREEFMAAQKFLKELALPFFAVPGNHDIPRANFLSRFTDPYARYERYIHDIREPIWRNENICIAGINTARRILPHWNWANGAISPMQLMHLDKTYSEGDCPVKICVMHHPVHKAEGNPLKTVVFNGPQALQSLMKMKVNLVLTGHVHHASITTMENEGHKTVFLSASTALSRRLRNQSNGYNVITLNDNKMQIEIFHYKDGRFSDLERFEQTLPSPAEPPVQP